MEYQGTGLREQGTGGTQYTGLSTQADRSACGGIEKRGVEAPPPTEGAKGGAAAVRTAEIVAAEIRAYTASMLNDAVEIGRRLVEAKELVPYGEFESWVERETGYSSSSASNFMRLFTEYGDPQGSLFGASLADPQTYGKLTKSKLLLLLSVPREERAEFVKESRAEELSTRELQAAIRERDEAKRAQAEAEKRAAEAEEILRCAQDDNRAELEAAERKLVSALKEAQTDADTIAGLKQQLAELEARPVEVAVAEPDPEEIERRAAALIEETRNVAEAKVKTLEAEAKAAQEEHEKRLKELQDKAKAEREKLKEKLKAAEEKAAEAEKRGAEDVAPYKAEAEELRKKLAMSGEELVTFKLRFAAWQRAYNEMRLALDKLGEEQGEKCAAAVQKQLEAWEKADRSEFRDQSSEKGDEDREKGK